MTGLEIAIPVIGATTAVLTVTRTIVSFVRTHMRKRREKKALNEAWTFRQTGEIVLANTKESIVYGSQKVHELMERDPRTKVISDYVIDAGRAMQNAIPAIQNRDVGQLDLLAINTTLFSILAFSYFLMPNVVTLMVHYTWWAEPELITAIQLQGVFFTVLALVANTTRIFEEANKCATVLPRDVVRCFLLYFALNVVSTLLFQSTGPQMVRWLEFFLTLPLLYAHFIAGEINLKDLQLRTRAPSQTDKKDE